MLKFSKCLQASASALLFIFFLSFFLVAITTAKSLAHDETNNKNEDSNNHQQQGGYVNPYHEVFPQEQQQNAIQQGPASSALAILNSASSSNSENQQQQQHDLLTTLPVARLRRFLVDREADCDGCVDKRDLVERAVEVMSWPTRDDAIANDLSLEQDLMGPLVGDFSIPSGEDRSPFQDQYDDEPLSQNPSARASVAPLSDEEVVQLLEIHRLRMMIADGVARCGPRMLNGTQYCGPAFAIVEKATSADM